jgi:metal-sulfur cluster biosynthetic enzyme
MTAAITATETDIRTALRDCYDPTLPCNIVDLGLLRSISLTPDPQAPGANIPGVPQKHLIQITLTLTNPTDASEAQLQAQVINRLAGLQTVSHTTVTFTHNPPWTPQQITPEGRRTLGLEGNPTLVQIR